MDYSQYIKQPQQTPRLGLERIEALVTHLGNPQDTLNVIHVAGTNGKGSVCSILLSVLERAGYKVGRYLSPELLNANERISINQEDITDRELARLSEKIRPAAGRVSSALGDAPSPFEVSTAAAFYYFAEQNCDFAIIETGLGGREDATNVCRKPLVTVITTIDTDHIEFLGDTIEKIAFEKAGIIKEGVPCVSAPQLPAAGAVLCAVCDKKKSPLIFTDWENIRCGGFEGINERFDYKGRTGLKCGLAGMHQVINCAAALDVIDILNARYGASINEDAIYSGVLSAVNKARMEILSRNPFILFDGAHNLSGAKALAASLARYFKGKKFTFVIAVMRDKDARNMICALSAHAKCFIATQVPGNPRSMPADVLYQIITGLGFPAVREKDFTKALSLIQGDTVICGSLYAYQFVKLFQ